MKQKNYTCYWLTTAFFGLVLWMVPNYQALFAQVLEGGFNQATAVDISFGQHQTGVFNDVNNCDANAVIDMAIYDDDPDFFQGPPDCARWFKFTPTETTQVIITTRDGLGNPLAGNPEFMIFYVYEDNPVPGSFIQGDGYLGTTAFLESTPSYAELVWEAVAGSTYYIVWTNELDFSTTGESVTFLFSPFIQMQLNVTETTAHSLTLSWTDYSQLGAVRYELKRSRSIESDGSLANDPVDELTTVYNGSATTFVDDGHPEGSRFYYEIVAFDENNQVLALARAIGHVEVEDFGLSFLLRESFEDYATQLGNLDVVGWNNIQHPSSQAPDAWRIYGNNLNVLGLTGDHVNWRGDVTIVSTAANAQQVPLDNWLVTPPVQIPLSGAQLVFWGTPVTGQGKNGLASGNPTSNNLSIYVSTTGNTLNDFDDQNPIADYASIEADGFFHKYEVDLTPYAGQQVWIAIRHTATFPPVAFTLDDIVVRQLPAPSFAEDYPFVSNITTTSFRIHTKTEQDGTIYAVVLPDGAPEPSGLQVKDGKDGDGQNALAAGSWSATANQASQFDFIDLTPATNYDVYVVLQADNNAFSVVVKLDVATNDPDMPVWATGFPQMHNISDITAQVRVRIDRNGRAYAVVVPEGAAAPTPGEVKAGQSAGGGEPVSSGANLNLLANQEGTISLAGLSPSTNYDVYVVAESSGSTLQASAAKLSFTTLGPQPPVFASGYPAITNVTWNSFVGVVRADRNGTAYLVVVNRGATAPTSVEVKNGQAAGGASPVAAAQVSLVANQEASLNVGGLQRAAQYDVYFVLESDLNALEATPTKREVNMQTVVTAVELPVAEVIKLYPNPSKGTFTIDMSSLNQQPQFLRVFDAAGRMLTSVPIQAKAMQLDLSAHGAGLYLVQIETEGALIVKRVVVE